MFDPDSNQHVNFNKVICEKLEIDSNDQEYVEVMQKLNNEQTWLAILKVAAEYRIALRLMSNTTNKVTYTRFDREYGQKEYLSYTGNNYCSHWKNSQYYHQNCPGVTFGPEKHCNTLITVCWMDLTGAIEKVQIPKQPTKLNFFMYHMYEKNCKLNNELIITLTGEDGQTSEIIYR